MTDYHCSHLSVHCCCFVGGTVTWAYFLLLESKMWWPIYHRRKCWVESPLNIFSQTFWTITREGAVVVEKTASSGFGWIVNFKDAGVPGAPFTFHSPVPAKTVAIRSRCFDETFHNSVTEDGVLACAKPSWRRAKRCWPASPSAR